MIRDLSPSQFSLAHLGLSEQGPVPLIEAAAASGFRAVGLPLRSGALKPLRHEIVGDPAMIRAIRRALAATGVQVFDVESLVLGYEPDADGLRRIFGTAAEIGASRMSCLGPEHGGDAARRAGTEEAGRLNAIARVAAEFGLRIGVEFMMFRAVRTLADALDLVARADAPNLGVIVDALHLHRSGGTAADVAAIPAGRLSHIQFCDAAAEAPDDLTAEARAGRLLPGDGVIPLRDLMAALPDDAPLALEIPVAALAALPVAGRVARGARSLRALA